MIIWKLIKVAWRLVKLALLMRRLAKAVTRPTRVRRMSRSCIKWHTQGISGGRPDRLGDWPEGYGLIPTEITEERMAAMRQALLNTRGAGSGLERGPIILHIEEEAPRAGKSNLLQHFIDEILQDRPEVLHLEGEVPPFGEVLDPLFRERAEHLTAGKRTSGYPLKCLCVRYLPARCPAMAAPGLFTCTDCRGDCVVVTSGRSARHAAAPDYEFTRPRSCPSCQSIRVPREGCTDRWHS